MLTANFLKQFPFLRIVIPFSAGILLQWYYPLHFWLIVTLFVCFLFAFFVLRRSLKKSFFSANTTAFVIALMLMLAGCFTVYMKTISNSKNWIGNALSYQHLVVVIDEPLIEKNASFKAEAKVLQWQDSTGKWHPSTGKIIIYFAKEDDLKAINYGDVIVFKKPLQDIKNSGNPGAFNYKEYCALNGIHHQVYLKNQEIIFTQQKQVNSFKRWLFNTKQFVIQTIRKNISGKQEQAVAEALLIGYRNDLDKDLVQAYSNTGVVHIIAISGLHLGMIYSLMMLLLRPFKSRIFRKLINPIIILLIIWIFTFLAGAAPSVLRAAVMFSIILAGDFFERKKNIYNSLAASAFILLVINPFSLWDVGFQLSYAAVFSIVLLQKPVYNLIYFKNPLLDMIWRLNAVTLAAQVFTLPFIIYHFHQVPTLFLIANMLAVPLSGLILYGEILLVCIGNTNLGGWLGKILEWLLSFMNNHIERLNYIDFAVIDNLQINIIQASLLMLIILCMIVWLREKQVHFLRFSLYCTAIFFLFYGYEAATNYNKQRLVVYAVPKHTAVDILHQGSYSFIGDTALMQDGFLRNFHLKPSRIKALSNNCINNLQCNAPVIIKTDNAAALLIKNNFNITVPVKVTSVIISGNPKLNLEEVKALTNCKQIIADANNSLYKISKWKKQAEQLHLRFHSVADDGAFITDL